MSKFKLGPSLNTNVERSPTTKDEFVAGASLVQSQASSRPEKPIRLNLDLDPTVHKKLKIRAVENGTSVAALVRDLILRELH